MKIRYLITLTIIFLVIIRANSTHLKAGYILINHVSGNTYQITIRAYINTKDTDVHFSHGNTGILDFGDGTSFVIPETTGIIRPDLGIGINEVSVKINHTYSGQGSFKVSYQETNRNAGILNFSNSVTTPFYIESFFRMDPYFGIIESPKLLVDPILIIPLGQVYSYSFSAAPSNNNSLFYYIETPKQSASLGVLDYNLPEGFTINTTTGLLTWDTSAKNTLVAGLYAFAVKVVQVKDNRILGYTILDFQLKLSDAVDDVLGLSDNQDLTNGRLFIPEGTSQTIKIFVEDSNKNLDLNVYSELKDFSGDLISFTTKDSVTDDARNILMGTLIIKSNTNITRDNPYNIVVRATFDDQFFKDIGYAIYTKDIFLIDPNLVTETELEEDIQIHVFPNPVKDILFIENPMHKKIVIKLVSMLGVTELEKNINENASVDMRLFTSGIYFLTVNHRKTFKILKD